MSNVTEKLTKKFLSDVLDTEDCNNISIISSKDLSSLVLFLKDRSLKEVFIQPRVSEDINIQADLYVFMDDVDSSISDIGKVKNLLSQKIIYIFSNNNKLNENDLLKLGFQKEFEYSKVGISFYAYNLKTYNNKREWNNPKGWANPENFNKFRW